MRRYTRAPWSLVFVRIVAWTLMAAFSVFALIGGTVWLKGMLSALLNRIFK